MDKNIFLNKYKTVSAYSTLSFDCPVSFMNNYINNNLKQFYNLNIKVKITLNQHLISILENKDILNIFQERVTFI